MRFFISTGGFQVRTKKVKKIVSLFLAVLMCVTIFAGFGTTAYAAEETDEVYLISP